MIVLKMSTFPFTWVILYIASAILPVTLQEKKKNMLLAKLRTTHQPERQDKIL